MNNVLRLFLFLFLSLIYIGCSSTEQTSTSETEEDSSVSEQQNEQENNQEDVSRLMISNLSDSYSSFENRIPDEYSQIKQQKEVERDLTKGYRIQIYSGQNVLDADTVASTFRAWSDTTITGYQAETYTFFKTPYYRVHVGDFHDRERAFNFSKLVKRLFRDAWVVYDTVDPFSVPEDTVEIALADS